MNLNMVGRKIMLTMKWILLLYRLINFYKKAFVTSKLWSYHALFSWKAYLKVQIFWLQRGRDDFTEKPNPHSDSAFTFSKFSSSVEHVKDFKTLLSTFGAVALTLSLCRFDFSLSYLYTFGLLSILRLCMYQGNNHLIFYLP